MPPSEVVETLSTRMPYPDEREAMDISPGIPVLITVPNAFATAGRQWLAKGKENVNIDHVAWYSPRTLATLLNRAGYTYADLFYYNGDGPTAEGLIVVTE